ncbi:DUF2383 domain-containing protein [Dethiothermospora halolimnae]|uniref:DUF2383 domain-containing protein n=1 Tax=Dethiothermospora halolimnae TaxID=3114390 RepID=UPI003CCB9117
MNKNKETLKSMNSLLQGEYMALETFNVFISKVNDDSTKKTLREVQGHHRENIKVLANYIQDLGGQPDENLGFKGTMADMKLNMDLKGKNDHYIIEKVIEGETNGINMAEKVLRGNLDDKSRDFAGEILHSDRKYLDKLKTLM